MMARTRLAALALAGVLVASLASTGAGVPRAPAESSALTRGTLDDDRLLGAFWRPAGSTARRPVLCLKPVGWTPAEAFPRRADANALAPLQAAIRLAASD